MVNLSTITIDETALAPALAVAQAVDRKSMEMRHEEQRVRLHENGAVLRELQQLMAQHGLDPEISLNGGSTVLHSDLSAYSITLYINIEDLPKLYRAVGRVRVTCKGLATYGKNNGLMEIWLAAENERYSRFRFVYHKPIPEGGKCKVVEEISREKYLVCER